MATMNELNESIDELKGELNSIFQEYYNGKDVNDLPSAMLSQSYGDYIDDALKEYAIDKVELGWAEKNVDIIDGYPLENPDPSSFLSIVSDILLTGAKSEAMFNELRDKRDEIIALVALESLKEQATDEQLEEIDIDDFIQEVHSDRISILESDVRDYIKENAREEEAEVE